MLSSVLWGRGVASFKLRFSSLDLELRSGTKSLGSDWWLNYKLTICISVW